MARKRLDLSTFDGVRVDGLTFCAQVYDLFDQIQKEPDGISKMRLQPSKREKRLLEELIPLARFVQSRYREGRRMRVRWFAGSQPYDAILTSSGGLVDHGMARRRQFVEITTCAHPNDYLVRESLETPGPTWSAKSTWRDRKTGRIRSEPYVYRNDERSADVAAQVVACLRKKSAKRYPAGTVLIVSCRSDGLLLLNEWDDAAVRIEQAQEHLAFREVFLVEASRGFSATLYGPRRRRPVGRRSEKQRGV